mmetsp:Transcript_63469/g.137421  ORF Transcript_63469/g.137421 Transcript_63469/m.137421 type:complete len:515 (-) Transcript_63469:154-1698(-)
MAQALRSSQNSARGCPLRPGPATMGSAMPGCQERPARARRTRGVELADEYEYIDRAGHRQRRKATLSQGALHDTLVQSLRRARTEDLELTLSPRPSRSLSGWGCDFADNDVPAPVVDRALQIIDQARLMMEEVSREPTDVLDKDWRGPNGADPLALLLEESDPRLQAQVVAMLSGAAERRLSWDAVLVEARAPARVFGDIHGQLRDVLLLLHDFGFADDHSAAGITYVFNGDWVDRGAHQLEVVVLLFALKVVYPQRIVLVRGNHEDVEMNRAMGSVGFSSACSRRLGHEVGGLVFETAARVFDWLPLACLLEGHVLILHGGIGAGDWDLDYLRSVPRPLTHSMLEEDPVLWNILWSDPIPDEAEEACGVHSSPRDCHANGIATWCKDVTQDFCRRNDLDVVVRSHQALRGGCGYEAMHTGRCVRVFSARDYEGHDNDGSVLLVTREQTSGQLVIRPQVLRSLTKLRRERRAEEAEGTMLAALLGGRLLGAQGKEEKRLASARAEPVPPLRVAG